MKVSKAIGLQSLAQSVPGRILIHDPWRQDLAESSAGAAHPSVGWHAFEGEDGPETFRRVADRYARDPFGGARERRILSDNDTSLELEATAARQALAAAHLTPDDIDLLICTSMLPDHLGIGGATYLARELALQGAAWNVESGNSSALTAFQTACSLIASGQHRRALVVTSCAHSRATEEVAAANSGVGDGATAMVVGKVAQDTGYLGGHSLRSAESEPTGPYALDLDAEGKPQIRSRNEQRIAKVLRQTAEATLEQCVGQALDKAGVLLADIDHFVVDTPRPWFAAFCARTLDLDSLQPLSLYPLYGDAGPALLGLNLLHAAHWKRFQPGELVLLYSASGDSNSSAAVMRWSKVALGALPEGVSLERLEDIESETVANYHLRRLDAEALAPARRASGLENRLQRMISGYVALAVDEPGVMRLFIEERRPTRRPETIRTRANRFVEALEDLLAECFATQSSEIEPKVAALSLLGVIDWGICCHRSEQRLNRDEAIAQITFLALHGLISEPPPRPGRRAVMAA